MLRRGKKWLSANKTRNISKMAEDRAKVINWPHKVIHEVSIRLVARQNLPQNLSEMI